MAVKKSHSTATRARRGPSTVTGSAPAAGPIGRAIETTIRSGETLSVGVLHLMSSTLRAAVSGVQDVGREIGTTAVAAVRGSIQAASDIGGDLAIVAERAVKGTVGAAGEIGREFVSGRKPGAAVSRSGPRRAAGRRRARRTAA
jgi:hypothetical protein